VRVSPRHSNLPRAITDAAAGLSRRSIAFKACDFQGDPAAADPVKMQHGRSGIKPFTAITADAVKMAKIRTGLCDAAWTGWYEPEELEAILRTPLSVVAVAAPLDGMQLPLAALQTARAMPGHRFAGPGTDTSGNIFSELGLGAPLHSPPLHSPPLHSPVSGRDTPLFADIDSAMDTGHPLSEHMPVAPLGGLAPRDGSISPMGASAQVSRELHATQVSRDNRWSSSLLHSRCTTPQPNASSGGTPHLNSQCPSAAQSMFAKPSGRSSLSAELTSSPKSDLSLCHSTPLITGTQVHELRRPAQPASALAHSQVTMSDARGRCFSLFALPISSC
jgi:hypothetical protein